MHAATRLTVILSGLSASVVGHSAMAQIVVPVPDAGNAAGERLADRIKASKAEVAAESKQESVADLIAKLDDPSITVRQDSEKQLMSVAMTQAQLEEAIQNPKASPEQRLRLDRLGPSVLYRTPRAAVGIRFSMKQLEVGQLIEGFDAQRVLQVGDEIVSVAGHAMNSHNDLRPAIVMHSPGAEVTMRVIRQGRPLTLRLTLGDFDALPAVGWRDNVTFEDCRRAWELRSSDLREERHRTSKTGAVLDIGVDAAAWERLKQGPSNIKPDPTTMPWGDLTLTAGGAPRESGLDLRGGRQTLSINGDRGFGGLAGVPQQQLKRIEDFQRFIELQQKLDRNNLDEATRKKLLAEIQELTPRVFEDVAVPDRRKP